MLQQYVDCELLDVQAGFRKSREARDQIANICWIIKKAREFWKILQEMGIPDNLTCFLRNLNARQKATLELDVEQWTSFKLGKSTSRLYIVTLLF